MNSWLDNQTITASGCTLSDAANISLVEVDGVLRLFFGSNCDNDQVNHVYFTWRWSLNAWDKVKDSIIVSEGYTLIKELLPSDSTDRLDNTIEIDCPWSDDNYQACRSIMPAGGPKKIGVQFSGEDINNGDMVSAW